MRGETVQGVPISNQFLTCVFWGYTFLYLLTIHLRKKVGLGFVKLAAGGNLICLFKFTRGLVNLNSE
jgi:hypothetical protein